MRQSPDGELLPQRDLEERQAALSGVSDTEFSLDVALRECLEVTRETALLWERLTPGWRLRFQNVIFVNGEMRFDGSTFWNSPLTSIYQLNRDYAANPS